MKCPQCKTTMIVVERNQVELDFCTSCRGIWFDEGELELLLNDVTGRDSQAVLSGLLNSAPIISTEQRFKCPICRKHMQKIDIGRCGSLVIDACKEKHGAWFDGGEVGCLIEQLDITRGSDLTGQDHLLFFVADTFSSKDRAETK
jgi:Zn-finger nucleic acid-binding protein